MVDFASSRGKKSIAAMIPNTAYGNVVAAAFQEAAAQRGVRVAAMERYNTNDKAALDAAAQRIAALGNQADALFLPENGEGMAAAGAALATAGIDSRKLQLLGTSAWDDPRVLAVKSIQGGWFAAPAKAGFNSFAARYRARFGSEPTRSASLAYDAVFLVQALFAKLGPDRADGCDAHQCRRRDRYGWPVPLPSGRDQPARHRSAPGRNGLSHRGERSSACIRARNLGAN